MLTEIQPVSFRELHEGLHVEIAAAQGLPLRKYPSEYPGFVLRDIDGSARRMGLTDHWMNRAVFALYDYTDRNFPKAWWIHTRLQALSKIVMTERVKPWVVEEGDTLHLHHALLEAAACMPLRRDFSFDEDGFFKTVERIGAEMDADRRGDAPPTVNDKALDTAPQPDASCDSSRPEDLTVNSEIRVQRVIKRRHRKSREEIETVRILARKMLAEGASHREVCIRLRDSPRPPNAAWSHLPGIRRITIVNIRMRFANGFLRTAGHDRGFYL